MDLRKSWHNTPGHIFFHNPGILYVFNTSLLFSKSVRKKIYLDYSYFNFEKHDSFFRMNHLEKNPPGLIILKTFFNMEFLDLRVDHDWVHGK